MRKQPAITKASAIVVIEAQVFLTARGRSVVNGTLLVEGEMRTIKHDLPESVKNRLIEALLRELSSIPVQPV